ncbi:MAG TPA: hypothetical protein VMU19_09985 [Bryobacteraceae bacterium]|nr:hypothetical protein [Bryobacteraceae bacterium]
MIRRIFFALALALIAAPVWAQITLNPLPSRTAGHPQTPLPEQNSLYSMNPNLVEGRELYQPEGIAVDTSVSPNPIYVSDTGNNRVLGWKDASSFANGQKADIVIGQNDFFTTWAQGPAQSAHAPGQGNPLQSGLNAPTGLAAVHGDLYVADSGNNRVLRYPQPFANSSHIPDLVIGQTTLAGSTANYTGAVSAQGVSLSGFVAGIAFDSTGNLWMTDPGNRRVLEFAAADVAKSGATAPTAILELGQADFTTLRTNLNPNLAGVGLTANQFAIPAGIAFDPQGRLYVSDYDSSKPQSLSRVLVFAGPFTSAMSASNIMGVFQAVPGITSTPAQIDAIVMNQPLGIFFTGSQVGVVDSGYNRVTLFLPLEQWPAATSPSALDVMGQSGDFTAVGPNHESSSGQFVPAASTSVFYRPFAAAYANGQLYVADAGNNRVLAIAGPFNASSAATRWLGQDLATANSPNLVEGRELQLTVRDSSGLHADSGIAVDTTGATPHLYVADTYNNRILAFKDLRKVTAGVAADLIIGQAGGQTASCNYPTGDPLQPTKASLCSPTGLAVDSKGNLWVADRGNGRVLRFPSPFTQTGQPQADLVLGQPSFTTPLTTTDPTASTLAAPYGVALATSGLVIVSDQVQNRVLVFQPVNGVFTNGQSASWLLGQPGFNSAASGSAVYQMSAPHHLAIDANDRPYVTDSGNNRVLIYDSLDNPQFPAFSAPAAIALTGFSTPEGIFVNPSTGEIWVADTSNGIFKRYPAYNLLVSSPSSTGQIQAPTLVMAVAQDQFGALVAVDAANRVALYYPGLTTQNMANGLTTWPLTPGMIATVLPANSSVPFGSAASTSATQLPLPTSLANLEVLFQGVPAPLFMASPTQINFYVPMGAPTSGLANVEVDNAVTGQVYGAGVAVMNSASPGLFLNPPTATGTLRQAAVINFNDGSLNGSAHPALRGTWVEIFGTGEGFVSGAPADGSAPTGPIPTALRPVVLLNGVSVDDPYFAETFGDGTPVDHIYYSGLAPGLVGVWQIDVKIPLLASPGTQVPLTVFANSLSSIPSYNYTQYITTIAIQ